MNKKQIAFLKKIGIDPNASLDVIEEEVGNYLALNCLNEDYEPDSDGKMCECILDYISEQ